MTERAGSPVATLEGAREAGPVATITATAEERPELVVAGAFGGGLALAFLLKQVVGG